MSKSDSGPVASTFRGSADRFAILMGRTAMVLSLVAAAYMVVFAPFVASIPACTRPAWLEEAGERLGFSSIVLTFLVGGFSALIGLIVRKARAISLGLASISVLVISFFIAVATMNRGENFNGDGAAVANLRTINAAEVTYNSSHDLKYGTIEDLTREELLDSRFVTGPVSGYNFKVSLDQSGYTATATRDAANCSARWDYFTESDAIIRYSRNASRAPRGKAGQPAL